MSKIVVRYKNWSGEEQILIKGRNDDIFLIVPNEPDEEGNPHTRIISKKALLEMADKLR